MYKFFLRHSHIFLENDSVGDARSIAFDTAFSYSCCSRPEFAVASGRKMLDWLDPFSFGLLEVELSSDLLHVTTFCRLLDC